MVSPESWVLLDLVLSIFDKLPCVFDKLFDLILFGKLLTFKSIDADRECVKKWVLFNDNLISILVNNFFWVKIVNNFRFLRCIDILVLSLGIDRSCSFFDSCHVGIRLTRKSVRNLRPNNLVAIGRWNIARHHGHSVRGRSAWSLFRSQSLKRE